ncbi:hypothetical protein OsI_11266 [Oryza sativa Indica Group]|uniref:Uncharacterized protein n=1 Tax=Oryza sativa subsp. indica TaxID=39946 RepID=A2XFW8_ORYSI|nr:hypothetical protein OsI_11266 [Oryza sativa Indica Group]
MASSPAPPVCSSSSPVSAASTAPRASSSPLPTPGCSSWSLADAPSRTPSGYRRPQRRLTERSSRRRHDRRTATKAFGPKLMDATDSLRITGVTPASDANPSSESCRRPRSLSLASRSDGSTATTWRAPSSERLSVPEPWAQRSVSLVMAMNHAKIL